MQKYCIKTSNNICFGYLLESAQWGNSNKCPKHTFCEDIRIKQGFSNISFCPVRILYNSKFIWMATSLATNAVIVMRVHCTTLKCKKKKQRLPVIPHDYKTKTDLVCKVCMYINNWGSFWTLYSAILSIHARNLVRTGMYR